MTRTCVAALLVAGVISAVHAQTPSTQAPTQSVLAGRKLTPPLKGEALIEHTRPVTRRENEMIVTRVTVKNAALAPVARLTVTETWYAKDGTISTESRGVINGLLQPGEVQVITVQTAIRPGVQFDRNAMVLSHANGTVRPRVVDKLEVPPPPKP
jgi:hypothetical protein